MTKDDRLEIKLRLIEQLVENPNFEATPADMEYWEPLHDKLKNKLTTCEALAIAVLSDQTSHDEREKTFEAKVRKECAAICRKEAAETDKHLSIVIEALEDCAYLIEKRGEK